MTARSPSAWQRLLGPRAVLVGALAAGWALVMVACGTSDQGGSQQPSAGPAQDPGMVHVHGLGIDPADGALYVATHHGLFRLLDQGPELVGSSIHDLMGFAVADPGHFYASGHPAIHDEAWRRPGHPPLLGLIETTDAGQTWRSVSLLGEADFHALTIAHDTIWGHDATTGRLLASSDGGRTWHQRSQLELAVHAIAASPTDDQVLVAAAGGSHLHSTDGGRTWTAGDPALLFLSWDPGTGILWGIDPTGALWASPDGESWEPRSMMTDGRPEALLASDDRVVVATTTGIYDTIDAGTTWTTLHRVPGTGTPAPPP